MPTDEYSVGDLLRFVGEPHPDRDGVRRHLGAEDEGETDESRAERIERGSTRAPLMIDSVGRVEARVAAEEDGAGSHEADSTVLSFPQHGVVYEVDGVTPRLVEQRRHISFEDHQLHDWFEPAGEDA